MKNWREIEGYSSWPDQGVMMEKFAPQLAKIGEAPLKIVEVGVYKGRLTSMWCGMLLEMGRAFDYHCVDNFQGLEIKKEDPAALRVEFYSNTLEMGERIWATGSRLTVHDKNSKEAADKFEDGTLDLVYLDAAHDFTSVDSDIQNWWGKLRIGGVLCGDDYVSGWPGVMKAVDQNFGPEIGVVGNQQWWVVK